MLYISTACRSGTFSQRLDAISEAGFKSVDVCADDARRFLEDPDGLSSALSRANLSVASVGPLPEDCDLPRFIKFAKAIHAPTIILNMPAWDSDMIPDLDALQGLKVAFLPTRQSEAVVYENIKNIAHPNLGLALRSARALGDGSRPARLRDIEGRHIFHVTLDDGENGQLLPGQGTLNLQGFIRILSRSGYCGGWAVCASNQNVDSAQDGYRALLNLLDEVAKTEPSMKWDMPALAPRVPATGIEFIEFAVDEESAKALTDMLRAMAFRRERRHMSKDVSLWRQGAVNIVINKETHGHAREAFNAHGPTVCDMGLRVSNARETVARAKVLGTKSFVQNVGLGELKIPAIRGVGGNIIHFIDEQSDLHRVWDIEFEAVKRTKATQPAGLRRIDHVAQTMKYDEMQSWLLYYISTFEMEKSAIVNVQDPSGLVLSQAIESPEGEMRLNINGALGADTIAGSFIADALGAGVQHLAFATDDIFETTDLLEKQGFENLQISPEYYAETKAEFDLDDAFISQLQSRNILYDRDEMGEYFQLYSQIIFGGFFFEIVQRRNGYKGYGARNASARLSAQTTAKQMTQGNQA